MSVEPLRGGVSSDIWLVIGPSRSVVVKRARERLDVEQEWLADTSRNETEQAFARLLKDLSPGSVPELLSGEPGEGYFVMEYLDDSFTNWKEELLSGRIDSGPAEQAARLLALIHRHSAGRDDLARRFDTTDAFLSLRIEPYLIATAARHPDLKEFILTEADRLLRARIALVHGDFSPKNMLAGAGRLVLLDHEAAWYGDPLFDAAFLLNHLHLKMIVHRSRHEYIDRLSALCERFWSVYRDDAGFVEREKSGVVCGRLLLLLMLARVDGKSPVEYLDEAERAFVRAFVYDLLPKRIFELSEIRAGWKSQLERLSS